MAASDITMIEQSVFVEGILRLHAGTITASDFNSWISQLGLVEIARLGGSQTYEVARETS